MDRNSLTQILTPGLKNSHFYYSNTLDRYIDTDSRWLDLGCGNQIVPRKHQSSEGIEHTTGKCKIICGVDSEYYQLLKNQTIRNRVLGDILGLPFHDSAFNVVTAGMVVEHFKEPVAALKEIDRVLEPGGVFIIHTVNLLSYFGFFSLIMPRRIKLKLIEKKGGRVEDNFPTYYRLNTYFRIKRLARMLDFKIYELKFVETSLTTHLLPMPINFIELILIKCLRLNALSLFRTNILCVLMKKGR